MNYAYDNNGNLLTSDTMTNTWDAANRAIAIQRLTDSAIQELVPEYDGLGNRVAQTKNATTTYYALDVGIGLPEVIYTSEGNAYLHLAGVMMTENITGTTRYLLSDGLGSVRHVVDDEAEVVSYKEYDPYGQPIRNSSFLISNYGYTGEWWEDEVDLLYLRARWYAPEIGTFLSRDAWQGDPLRSQSLHGWTYASSNPINRVDPSGLIDWHACQIQGAMGTCTIQSGDYIYMIARQIAQKANPNADEHTINGLAQLIEAYNSQLSNPNNIPVGATINLSSALIRLMQSNDGPGSQPPPSPPVPPEQTCADCDPNKENFTNWLLETQQQNARGLIAGVIRGSNLNSQHKIAAYLLWTAMVKKDAPWDFKDPIREAVEPPFSQWRDEKDGKKWVKICCDWYHFEVFANIHYGYVGKSVLFQDSELLGGAGIAQIIDNYNKRSYRQQISEGRIGIHTYFDDPADGAAIQLGIVFYQFAQASSALEQPTFFCELFNQYASQFRKRP